MNNPSLRSMPQVVRQLRDPWKSLQTEIPFLTPALEWAFRFGHRVHHTPRGYLLGGNMKGGSSGVWRLCSEEERESYELWRQKEAILEAGSDDFFQKLCLIFRENNIAFLDGETSPFQVCPAQFSPKYGEIYQLTFEILSALPPSHLENSFLSTFQLGGFGPDSAKGSAYQDGKVMMYSFTTRGARRPYAGLLLHELGHAHEDQFSSDFRIELKDCYQILSEKGDFVGMEYLSDSQSRKTYQSFQFEEFLAETYLAYVVWGQNLLGQFQDLSPEAQRAWERVYSIYRETFEGYEYL